MSKSILFKLTIILLHLITLTKARVRGTRLSTNNLATNTNPKCDCTSNNPHKITYLSNNPRSNPAQNIYCHHYGIRRDTAEQGLCTDLDPPEHIHIAVDPWGDKCDEVTCDDYKRLVNVNYPPCSGCTITTGQDFETSGKPGITVTFPVNSLPSEFKICMNGVTEIQTGYIYIKKKSWAQTVTCTGTQMPKIKCGNDPTTARPTTKRPTTTRPTTTTPTTTRPTTTTPTTASPTKSPTLLPTSSPIRLPCVDFHDGSRTADVILVNDMSLIDGSYNDACDYYQPGAITISLNNKLKGTDYFGPGQIRIGETMEVEFDLHLKSYCNSNGINDCIIFRIGEATDDKYPVIQLGTHHTIKVTVSTINGIITKTSPVGTVHNNHITRIKLIWSQTKITLIYDGHTVIDEAVDSHKFDTTPYTNDDLNLRGVFRLKLYAGDIDNTCADPLNGKLETQVFSCLVTGPGEVFKKYCDSNDNLRYTTWALDACPADPTSAEAIAAEIESFGPFSGPDHGPHECCFAGETLDADIKNLCIKTSHVPIWDKHYWTMCYIKQNFIAETMSTVKGNDAQDQAPDLQGQIMNVRSAYLEYDGSGARMITGLDDSFNYWPVTAAEFLVEFRKIQSRECGIGTNDRTDLCSGLKTAFAEFENNGNVGPDVWAPKPERERKIIIFSNNEQENNLYCSNGKHICEEYEDKIYGWDNIYNGFGVSVVMVNIDMDGTPVESYLPCLTRNETTRIIDVISFGNLADRDTNRDKTGRDAQIDKIQEQICAKVYTPNPTSDPSENPTTAIPTTNTPTTNNPTTNTPTTFNPTTNNPTTNNPTTNTPTTFNPTTNNPTTFTPTTNNPTTNNPTTNNPTTTNPTTNNPTTNTPTTFNPTTNNPTTFTPTTNNPTTNNPTTNNPTTTNPTTNNPTTNIPTTFTPTTNNPTTNNPTTNNPTTFTPTTNNPTTNNPTTNNPTTFTPTTFNPTTNTPTTFNPTTNNPTTYNPTTFTPTTNNPTTFNPTTNIPTTNIPTTFNPTTNNPTTNNPTTNNPTTNNPTTNIPTTFNPTTNNPTTNTPTTFNPTTNIPTTFNPTTNNPTTNNPTTNNPTTNIPTTNNPTTNNPTTFNPTTNNPTTFNPTTNNPTTNNPTTFNPTTNNPTTNNPTTNNPTTTNPTTNNPTTFSPTTTNPTTNNPTTNNPTTNNPTTRNPTTPRPVYTPCPTSKYPTTFSPTTNIPTTFNPTTNIPTTFNPTTNNPTTNNPTTNNPTTNNPTTNIPTTFNPTTNNPTTRNPTTPPPVYTPAPTTTTPPPANGCPIDKYIDLLLIVDTSCPMDQKQCVDQQQLVANTFNNIRNTALRKINTHHYYKIRVAYVEMSSNTKYTTHIDFDRSPNKGKGPPYNKGDNSQKTIDNPAQNNHDYYNFIINRGNTICNPKSLSNRAGNPALSQVLTDADDELFPQADSLNIKHDREIIIFSNCAANNRAKVCQVYIESEKRIIFNNRELGINVQMINYIPITPYVPTGKNDMIDPNSYLACLVEYDPSGRIFVYDATNADEVITGTRRSVCDKNPSNAPTVDPTIDPTQDPSAPTAYGPQPTAPTKYVKTPTVPTTYKEIPTTDPTDFPTTDPTGIPTDDPSIGSSYAMGVGKGKMDIKQKHIDLGGVKYDKHGDNDKDNGGKDVYALYAEYSLWVFTAIVTLFALNVCVCAYCKCMKRRHIKSNGKKYGFIDNKAITIDDDDDTDSELDDDDIERLVNDR